jgi:hypothetical protein
MTLQLNICQELWTSSDAEVGFQDLDDVVCQVYA